MLLKFKNSTEMELYDGFTNIFPKLVNYFRKLILSPPFIYFIP